MNREEAFLTVPGKLFSKIKKEVGRLTRKAQLRFPALLGMPIKDPVIQLYRCDNEFDTHINLVNYLSFYNPELKISIVYEVVVFNKFGKKIIGTHHEVKPFQTLMKPIKEMAGRPVDEYGVFYIKAKYQPDLPLEARYLGETSPQFMTLFIPKSDSGAPQMVHSHKIFERLPSCYSPTKRYSSSVEEPCDLESLSFYVLNSSAGKVKGAINLTSFDSSEEATARFSFEIPGHGVQRVEIPKAELEALSGTVMVQYEYDRGLNHMKPIQFRTFKNGYTTANHS